jgi:hypothetical protein
VQQLHAFKPAMPKTHRYHPVRVDLWLYAHQPLYIGTGASNHSRVQEDGDTVGDPATLFDGRLEEFFECVP